MANDSTKNKGCPAISLPAGFQIRPVDHKLNATPGVATQKTFAAATSVPPPPLGVLSNFQGTFQGHGLNLIFRPNSIPPTETTFPNPVAGVPIPQAPNENVLEINLTQETLAFSQSLGNVPNRGLQAQNDIFLNGVPYVQTVNDVTNPETGKADAYPTNIHFEPGLWMHIPLTKADPAIGESLVRMGSIPHGTTINAQTLAPSAPIKGAPTFKPVDITPFPIGANQATNEIRFASQTATNINTPRIPQDLTKFIAAGTITQGILDNPNLVLSNAIAGQNITSFFVFTVSTNPVSPELGGGTANIGFLQGDTVAATGQTQTGPNANAAQMQATFWIETVQYQISVPPFKPGQEPLLISPAPNVPNAPVPIFEVNPPHEIKDKTTITVTSTQIQYSQLVQLNFAGLTWPHVSVATLVPQAPQAVPASAFK